MLTKEECKQALDIIENGTTEFESYDLLPNGTYNEFDEQINIMKQLIKEHFDPQPYKLEELHEGMWVWDDEEKEIIHIRSVIDGFYFLAIEEEDVIYAKFEENRFFPLIKAMRYQNE